MNAKSGRAGVGCLPTCSVLTADCQRRCSLLNGSNPYFNYTYLHLFAKERAVRWPGVWECL